MVPKASVCDARSVAMMERENFIVILIESVADVVVLIVRKIRGREVPPTQASSWHRHDGKSALAPLLRLESESTKCSLLTSR